MEEFKIKGKRTTAEENEFLRGLGFKWCYGCKKPHPIESFLNNPHFIRCLECRKKHERLNRPKYKDKKRAYAAKYREKNREKMRKYQSDRYDKTRPYQKERYNKWREENKERVNRKKRENYAKNKEHFKEYKRRYRKENQERENDLKRKNYAENKEHYNEYKRQYRKLQKDNPLFQLAKRIRNRTYSTFRKMKVPKKSKTQEMLGCNWEELKIHIENQFTEGMSWDRLGEIHIDHIIPLASATTEEELIKLAHYTNLQPLWAEDNMAKGAKLEWGKGADFDQKSRKTRRT